MRSHHAAAGRLTPAQRAALAALARGPAFRVRNGWSFRGGKRIRLPTAVCLLAAGLVQQIGGRVFLTDAGRRALATKGATIPPAAAAAAGARLQSRPRLAVAPDIPIARRWWLD